MPRTSPPIPERHCTTCFRPFVPARNAVGMFCSPDCDTVRRPITGAETDRIIELHEAGRTTGEIAAAVNRARGTVAVQIAKQQRAGRLAHRYGSARWAA
jgi:hypothetical protein